MAERRRERQESSQVFLVSRVVARIAFYVLVILLGIFLTQRAYRFGYAVFHTNPMTGAPGREVAVTITDDMSEKDVGDLLEDKGLIRDSRVFLAQAKIYHYQIYPGTYVLNTSQTMQEMANQIAQEAETAAASETGETGTTTAVPETAGNG